MTSSNAKRLTAGLILAAAALIQTAPAGAADVRTGPAVIQLADIRDLFRRRGFPIATCESRCQEERSRCETRARNSDDRRDCRLSYSLCSNDCNVYDSR